MKTQFALFLVLISSFAFAQVPADLKFDNNFVNSENHWVVIPNKDDKKSEFSYGFLYYDESGGGYSLQQTNSFTLENGKFLKKPANENEKKVVRLNNSDIQFALLSDARIAEMKLEKEPTFLKAYNVLKNEDEKKLTRASSINGLRRPDLSLPMLQSLKAKSYSSPKLYFELAYANNALKKYDDAEKIIDEAEKKGFLDELLIKEKIYSYVHNNKLKIADDFLKQHLSVFKSSLYKEESIGNMVINYYNAKDLVKAKEWLAIYYREFPQGGKYKTDIEKLKIAVENPAAKKQ